jgi:1-acyl-sn-glycerol-3-phosphate acyltransferase
LPQTGTFLYAALKPWVRLGARLFFRKIEIVNLEKLPMNKPVILVANHQNAMLDPVVTCLYSAKQLHWLTRADIFQKPAINRLLRRLNMLPVYRERDRVSDIAERNNETFNECFARLKNHAVICIFPEGTHRGKKQLVTLKKGASRLVSGAMDAGIHDVEIVPFGLDYENYYHYRSDLLVRFGDPIQIDRAQLISGIDRAKSQTVITEQIRSALSSVMIDIREDVIYEELMFLRPLSNHVSGEVELGKQFDFFKRITLKAESSPEHIQFLQRDVHEWKSLSHQLKISEDLYREKSNFILPIALICFLPAAIISALFYFPIYAITENFVRSKVKDELFRNSIRLVFWTFLTPIVLLLFFAIISMIWNGKTGLVLTIATIISGLISLPWWQGWKLWKHQQHCNTIKRTNPDKFNLWSKKRSEIGLWLKKLGS